MTTELLQKMNIDKSNWTLVKFGDVVYEPKENMKDASAEEIFHVVGLEHIDSGDIHLIKSASIEESTTFTKKFKKNDVLFGRRRAYLKKAAQASFDGICSGDITVFRAKENLLPEILAFIVNNDKFFDYAIKHSAGGLSPRVKFRDLEQYEFLLPPKQEQSKIAELLWAMDDVIEREKEILKNLKKIYLLKVEKQLINKKNKKIYFKDLGKVIRGVGYKPEDLLDCYNDNNCVILRSNNIFESNINFDDIKILSLKNVKKEQILIDGDFAICMSNGSKELVGKSALYISKDMNVSIGSFCAGFRPNSILSRDLIEHLFASESYRQAIKRILTGSAINNLKPSDIEEMSLRIENDKGILANLLLELKLISNNMLQLDSKIRSSQLLQKSLINQVF